jgi:hypothetical protein
VEFHKGDAFYLNSTLANAVGSPHFIQYRIDISRSN